MVDLSFDGPVEIISEEEVKEVVEIERAVVIAGEMVAALDNLIDDRQGVLNGRSLLALPLHQEPTELIGINVVAAVSYLSERGNDVGRRLDLADLKFPVK